LLSQTVRTTEQASQAKGDYLANTSRLLVRFSVEYTGIGMSPEVLARIFSLFNQADGSIGVESQEGMDSAFHLRVPFSVP
jgi:signal transduction histidine kinase